jgi:hypothetical protein
VPAFVTFVTYLSDVVVPGTGELAETVAAAVYAVP